MTSSAILILVPFPIRAKHFSTGAEDGYRSFGSPRDHQPTAIQGFRHLRATEVRSLHEMSIY